MTGLRLKSAVPRAPPPPPYPEKEMKAFSHPCFCADEKRSPRGGPVRPRGPAPIAGQAAHPFVVWVLPLSILFFLVQGCGVLRHSVKVDESSFLSENVAGLPITLRYLPVDQPVVPLIQESVVDGLRRAGRWGSLQSPLTITIYPDHGALEHALHKTGYDWLKAWATDRRIYLQSPRSWPVAFRRNVKDLMAHEITHVIHYQTAGMAAGRSGRSDPFWFREGLASCTAEQGYRRYGKRQLWKKIGEDRSFDPMAPSPSDIRDRQKLAYSAAHHLVAYLIDRFGDQPIRDLLASLSRGGSFTAAFEESYPITLSELPVEWESWLRMSR